MKNSKFEDPFLKILPYIDLHGETSDTVWPLINAFIKESLIMGKYKIYVIHGRNGHVLKNTVHQNLKKDKRVDKYYIYNFNDGITIIELNKNNASKNK